MNTSIFWLQEVLQQQAPCGVDALDNVVSDIDSGVSVNQLRILIGRVDNECEVILFRVLLNKRPNLVANAGEFHSASRRTLFVRRLSHVALRLF